MNHTIKFFRKSASLLAALILFSIKTFAQGGGAAGIDAASSELTTYVDPLGNLLMVVGGLVGLVGAIRVYLKWNNGDQDTTKALMGWLGSCIFLVVSGIVIKAFFGL
jgi:hypothetical protein